jgi:hypothetical protein
MLNVSLEDVWTLASPRNFPNFDCELASRQEGEWLW